MAGRPALHPPDHKPGLNRYGIITLRIVVCLAFNGHLECVKALLQNERDVVDCMDELERFVVFRNQVSI